MDLIKVRLLKKPKTAATGGAMTGGGSTGGGSADQARYALDAAHAAEADHAATATHADEAAHAALASDLDADSPVRDEFLSKTHSDRTPHALNVGGRLTAEAGVWTDGFMPGIFGGSGGGMDGAGNAEVESITVRSAMRVQELIINRLQAMAGDQIYTENDIIDAVEQIGDNAYRLTLRKLSDDYFTAITAGSVLKGMINLLGSGGTEYYTSWMRVNSVNQTANSIEVSLYPVEDTPEGRYYEYADGEPTQYCPAPCELMKVARWGHQTDTSRQRLFYLSSSEGRLVRYEGVTKPIIDFSCVATLMGTLPPSLTDLLPPAYTGADGLYSRVIMAEQIVQIDHMGRPKPEVVMRGMWDLLIATGAVFFAGDTKRPDTGVYELSQVTHNGCLWQCGKTGTTEEPRWNSTDWALIMGRELTLAWADAPYAINPCNCRFTLTPRAMIGMDDVTDEILPADYEWTRYTEDDNGVPRTSSDLAWNLAHAGAGRSILVTPEDLPLLGGWYPKVVRFTVKVTLRDGQGAVAQTAGISQTIQ